MSPAVEILGWASGGLVMVSGFPNILRNLQGRGRARPSLARDGLQLAGNLGWTAYGVLSAAAPIAAMCGVNAALMAVLITQQLRRDGRMRVSTFSNDNRR